MSRIEEIDVRLEEIRSLDKDAEGIDLEALTAEVIALNEERSALVEAEEIETRKKALEEVIKLPEAATTPIVEERKMDQVEVRNTKEYIDEYAEYIKTGEMRKLVSENVDNGTVAVPDMVLDVIKTAWDEEGIMSLVKKAYLGGNLKVGFEISASGAVVHTEGGDAVAEETLVLGIVELVPASIKKWISISDEVMDLRGSAFLNYIYKELAYQIAKKAADELIAKIQACGTTSTTTCVGVPAITESSVAVSTVAKAIAQLSDQASNPVVMMNKLSYAAFKAVQYGNNYAVDPFEGCKVVFNNTIPAYSTASTGDTYAIVGDLGYGALANFPANRGIEFKFDDKTDMTKDLVRVLGRQYVGLGVVAPEAFCKIKK